MKRLRILIAAFALALPVPSAQAGPPEGDQGPGALRRGRPGAGQRPGAWPGQNARNRGDRPMGDPTQMVARLLKQFDSDGDQKLDQKELMALFGAMRERRGGPEGMRPFGRPERPGDAGRPPRGRGGPLNREGDRGMQRDGERMQRDGERRQGGRQTQRRRVNDNDQATPGGEKPKRPDSNVNTGG